MKLHLDQSKGANEHLPTFRATAVTSPQPVLETTAVFESVKCYPVNVAEQARNQQGSGGLDCSISMNFGWKNPHLTRLGIYHPLEVGNTTFPKERLREVLDLLPQTFRRLSLQAKCRESPVTASCWSLEQVELRISLWESRENKEVVVLEVQRCAGDSIIFSQYSMSILACLRVQAHSTHSDLRSLGRKAAHAGGLPVSMSPIEMPFLMKAEKLITHPVPLNTIPNGERNLNPTKQALEIANRLICGDRFDARLLGLESLCFLTNPNNVGLEVAVEVAITVLLNPSTNHPMNAILLPLAFTGSLPADDFHEDQEGMMKELVKDDDVGSLLDKGNSLAFLALQVLSQATQVLAHAEPHTARMEIFSFLSEARRLNGKDMVEALLDMVYYAPSYPHLAFLATQCLTALCKVLPELRSTIAQETNTVEAAGKVGAASHAALEIASKQLLDAIKA